jgi:hypothetical protein
MAPSPAPASMATSKSSPGDVGTAGSSAASTMTRPHAMPMPSMEASANERTLVYPCRARTTPCATPSMSPSSSPPSTPSSGKKLAAVLPGSMAALATSTESARATTSPSASARAVAITSAGSSGRGRADMVSLYRVTSGVHSPGGVGRRASGHVGMGTAWVMSPT